MRKTQVSQITWAFLQPAAIIMQYTGLSESPAFFL